MTATRRWQALRLWPCHPARVALAVAGLAAASALAMVASATVDSVSRVPVPEDFLACTTCHGVDLAGNVALGAPAVARLPAWYVSDQLQAFRSGWRGTHVDDGHGAMMQAQAALLDEAGIARASAWVAATGVAAPVHAARANAAPSRTAPVRGEGLYRQCAACHGDGGAGNEALRAPPLAGFSQDYLTRQLQLFRAGARGYHVDDTAGATMRAAVAVLADDTAVHDVAAYVATFTDTGRLASDLVPAATVSMQKTEDSAMTLTENISFTGLVGAATVALAVGVSSGAAAEVRRHALPGSDFPIAQAVEVLPGTTLVYHSGTTPRPADPDAEPYSPDYWGDTEAQTLSVFQRLEESLTAKGLTFGDVIKMQIFLVAPEAGGMMDFQGMMRAYRLYFGTEEQPRLPARSALQVAGLAAPGMLVEIEVVLARP